MSFLKYKVLAVIAALSLVLFAFYSRSPGGFFDDVVWPVAYVGVAAATLLAVFRPSRNTLSLWAGSLIGTEVLRVLSLLIVDTNDPERLARIGIHAKVAVLAYFVWVGWRYILTGLLNDDDTNS